MVLYFLNDVWQVMNNMLFHSILVGLKLMNSCLVTHMFCGVSL
jgi:hypothetical protein